MLEFIAGFVIGGFIMPFIAGLILLWALDE